MKKITEGSNTGWRLAGRDPNNYGDIGEGAVDLSFNDYNSTTQGATGEKSVAMGYRTVSNGYATLATGVNSTASGFASTTLGFGNSANGSVCTVIGLESVAMGNNTTAIGSENYAEGTGSIAIGYRASAYGQNTIAIGNDTYSQGQSTTAMGWGSRAYGEATTSMGFFTKASSLYSLAIGRANDTIAGSSRNSWIPTDPLFMVGNGDVGGSSNAMTVYKNGNTDLNGFVRIGKSSEDAPRIKTRKITATTSADHNGDAYLSHSPIAASKILSVSVLVEWTTDQFVPPAFTSSPDLVYNYYLDSANIRIRNNTPSGSCTICNKPVKVLITYEE